MMFTHSRKMKGAGEMEPIAHTLKELMVEERHKERLQKLKADMLSDEKIALFIAEHRLTESSISQSLAKLHEYKQQADHCRHCPGLENCPNLMQGYTPDLIINDGAVDVRYRRCQLKERADDERRKRQLFQSLYIPQEVLQARFTNLEIDPERIDAIQTAEKYVEDFVPGQTKHGLFYYGNFGVGKTYIMCAIANELANVKDVRSMIVYTPDFFRELKNAIGTERLHEQMQYIQTVPLLILDDIGAETISSWIRDEVLGAILQYRLMEGLPTLYTSNYDYDELEGHLAYSAKAGTELLKAKRIMERIRHYTTLKYIGGKNRRANMRLLKES